jgi:signal transduction histidine kinase
VSVLHPEDRDDVLAEARRCRQKGIPFEREYRLVTRTGEVIWVRDAAVPVGDPAAPRYWQGYVIDVTERKEVERWREQLLDGERLQNDRLRELDRMKDDFVASVSHELRTPLTSIRGYLDLVLDGDAGPLTTEQKQYLGVVARNSNRLLALVGDLLVVAQSDSGTLSVDRQASDLRVLASEAVSSAMPAAEDRGLALTLDAEEVPELDLDRARLGQVLDNLISNALKFTPRGGSVEVCVRSDGEQAVVEVTDTGMGMSAPEQERLFERFYRTESSATKAIPGTGLGLWISKTIIEAHGGEITVDSATGQGTTFRIELPLAAAA